MPTDFFELLAREVDACPPGENHPAAALLVKDDAVVARGHLDRKLSNDPLRYAAMDCIANAGRRNDQGELCLFMSREPNWLEAGTIVQFGIGGLMLPEGVATSAQIEFMRERGVNVEIGTKQ